IMSELSEYNLIPKEWGGDTFYIEISALKTKGIENFQTLQLYYQHWYCHGFTRTHHARSLISPFYHPFSKTASSSQI
ncbi:MAG: hypothetical protein Q8778_02655, partial [Sweet potato little leaf phytoplasma]|nr:hypothetical protein [Sweet potato little leaf phytoplasma]